MATLEQIEAALRAADAAGNAEDARALAAAYREAKAKQTSANNSDLARLITGKPKELSTSDQLVRAGKLGARDMIQGAMGTIGIASDPLAKGFEYVTGVQTPTAREAGSYIADKLGLPTPQNASERIGGKVTEALTGGAGLIKGGKVLANEAPGVVRSVGELLASRPGTQLASAAAGSGAAQTGAENGASPWQQAGLGLLAGLTVPAAMYGGAGSLRYLLRGGEEGRKAMQKGIEDFHAVGTEPSVGQATGNRRTQGLESLLAAFPTSEGRMAATAERQAAEIGKGLQQKAESLLKNASAERAGRSVDKGIGAFASKVKDMRAALYNHADSLVPETTVLPLTKARATLAELTTPTAGAEQTTKAMMNKEFVNVAQSIAKDLEASGAGGLPYSVVKAIRSRIGEQLSDFSLVADKPTAEYKRLYGALTQDMEEAAKALGPQAQQAVKRANAFYKASLDRLETVQRVVDRNGGPEKIYNAVMSGTQDGGTTLRAVMQSLPKDGQKAVVAAVIKRMGLPTAGQAGLAEGQYSAQTFLTKWNQVSPEAKRALFDRQGPKFVADMDRIARVSERIAKGSKVFANPSGSGKLGGALVYSGSLGGALLTGQIGTFAATAAGGAGAHVLARAMTNPRFVEWLAKATELPVSSVPQQALVLKRIAESQNDSDLAAIADGLNQGPNQAGNAANN